MTSVPVLIVIKAVMLSNISCIPAASLGLLKQILQNQFQCLSRLANEMITNNFQIYGRDILYRRADPFVLGFFDIYLYQ